MHRVTDTSLMHRQDLDTRSVSLAVFNNAAFAEVVSSADRILSVSPHTVTTRQIAAATGRADSVVRPVMKRLVAACLLNEPGKTSDRGPRPYSRSSPELWDRLTSLVDLLGDPKGPIVGPDSRSPS